MTLDLFAPEPCENLLPYDGEVQDYGCILSLEEAEQYFHYLYQHLAWKHDEAKLYGKHFITPRKVAWYGDDYYQYKYSGVIRDSLPWDRALAKLKQLVEQRLSETFNSCLANLYEDGTQGMAWHSDSDVSLAKTTTIASLSFGASRKFSFKHIQSKEKVELWLQPGQLIVMRGETQQHWQHRLNRSTKILQPRINLTFRQFQFS
ncbi:alpha-ketoglutarate-dependent dioxygenase AlkB family protein [Acinetobacter calcoaceticus]|uniref:alpha-ketoglutarate-dependent dioxygenase AlkB family protein n=1 Tax=Acinetobacter calcoaceticus TaxID=471 RepID=UPI001AE2752A|nr:alpha-ketoglutarate-dependent dioxygenase AlkB [Acinetobacter calcoaceticus]MBP2604874.1 alkylated DNA repair dioxygenase AlkB [Acinetobacter calcoaceticus]